VGGKNAGGRGVGAAHGSQGGLQPARLGEPAPVAGEHDAGAERLCEHQRLSRLQPGFAQHPLGLDEGGDGETERRLRRLGAMPADQHRPVLFQHDFGAAHHGRQIRAHLCRRHVGDCGDRQGGPGARAHRMEIGERVRRGDLAESEGIVDAGTEMVHALHHCQAGRRQGDGGIVESGEAERDVRTRRGGQTRERVRQHFGADFGAAAAAAHRLLRARHRAQARVHADPAAVDPIF